MKGSVGGDAGFLMSIRYLKDRTTQLTDRCKRKLAEHAELTIEIALGGLAFTILWYEAKLKDIEKRRGY